MRVTILSAVLSALAASAWAQGFKPMATAPVDSVPGGMNYQGRLEQNGFPVTGTRPIVFRLFDVATGGTELWSSGIQTVTITQGLFSASLNIPFAMLTGASQKYLELQVDGIVLAPRDPIGSVPYAKVAETVEGTIDVSTAGLTFTTPVGDSLAISSVSGRVGIGLNNPAARLHVSSGAGETSNIVIVSTGNSTLLTVDGNGKVTANSFDGDGSTLRNVVRRSGDSMSGSLTINAPSTLTVLGSAFSVGSTDLVVSANRTGVGTAGPLSTLDVAGTFAAAGRGVFGGSVTVRDAAQFGSGATVSSFSATGSLALDSNASLSAGTTFFVNNGRVGVGTASPSASSKLHVVGDVLIGNPTVHDTSVNSDLIVDGNVVIDGKFVQHGGQGAVFDVLGVAAEPQAGQTFAVGYTSFVVLSNGNVGVATLAPLAKFTANGDASFTGATTVLGSATFRGAAGFGSTGVSQFTTAGALNIASGQDITLVGAGAEVLGLPATPSATGAASKEYVDSQTLVGSGWTRDAGNTEIELSFIGDEVGIGTAQPLSKLDVAGTFSATGRGVFGGSVTVKGAAEFGPAGAGTGSRFDAAGALTIASAQNVTVSGGGVFSGPVSGNATTATALQADPTDCTLPNVALGINTSGTAQCAQPSSVTGNAATATALQADPTDAPSGKLCRGVNASGTCEQAHVDTTAASGSTNPVTSGALFTHAGLTGTSAHGAATANTFNAIVARDGSGNFAAGTITASLSGNATTASALQNNPADCGAGVFANAIASNGDLTCVAVGAANVSAGTFSGIFSFGSLVGLASFTSAQLAPGGGATTPTAQGQMVFNSTIQDICVSTNSVSGAWALAGSKGTGGCF